LDVVWASSLEESRNMKSVEAMGELLWNLK
jgi:hypothetical protein